MIMIFNSLLFIFAFLPISVLIYTVLPKNGLKNMWLLLISLVFYSWGNPAGMVLLILSILWNYLSAIELEVCKTSRNKKISFWTGVAVNLIILGFFKYTNFIFGTLLPNWTSLEIVLPVGLSFYTFSAISYLADVYTNRVKANHNLFSVGLYISFFGKVSMGPIVTYHDMENQLLHRSVDRVQFGQGCALFVKGLFKKVVFADQFALLYQMLQSNETLLGTWLLVLAFSLQLYFDFSGYSDMAIGIAKWFGFQFNKNFDHPYVACNAQDFWRRWHISLSNWFKEYVYIPLGGNRNGIRTYVRNIFIVWLCTGIWHGANWTFIAWGLYYAIILLLEKFYIRNFLDKLPKWISHVYALIVIAIGWIFFMSPSLSVAFHTLGRLFFIGISSFGNAQVFFLLRTYGCILVLGILFSTPLFEYVQNFLLIRLKNNSQMILNLLYFVAFIICIAFIVGSSMQMFLYSAF